MCEEGSIARAAEREALVASALSKRIGALEAEFGVPLLLRRRRGVEPTPAGEALLSRAREVLSALQRVRGELDAFGQGAQGSVRVLASPSVLAEKLPEDIAGFVARHAQVRVSLDERTSPDIVRSLREGAADAGCDPFMLEELHHVEQIARMLTVHCCDEFAAVDILGRDERQFQFRHQRTAGNV